MAGVQLRVDLERQDLSELAARLRRLGGSLRGPLAAAGELLRSQAVEAFETEASPGGTAWSESGRAAREGGQTLSDTGDLKNSLDTAVFPDRVEVGSSAVGSNKLYAAIHQFGGEAGPRSRRVLLPARPFFPDAASVDQGELEAIFERHIRRVLG